MVLNEQTYSNFYRTYYIGRQKGYDRNKATHKKAIYLTTNLTYAIVYAKLTGYIEEYHLREEINVFNARSEKDYYNLRRKLLSDSLLNIFTSKLDSLKDSDWTYVLGSFKKRDEILDVLKELGYDGYFNFEYTKDLKKNLSERGDFVPAFDNKPAIGVLNKDAFLLTHVRDVSYYKDTDKFKNFHDDEKESLKSRIIDLMINGKLDKDGCKIVSENMDYTTLTKEEKIEIIDSIDLDKIKDERVKFREWAKNTNLRYLFDKIDLT